MVSKADNGSFSLVANSDFVVHGILNPLFATEVSFRCLNRNVTEQKLDLLQLAPQPVYGLPVIRPELWRAEISWT
jgi:hypothetical protein